MTHAATHLPEDRAKLLEDMVRTTHTDTHGGVRGSDGGGSGGGAAASAGVGGRAAHDPDAPASTRGAVPTHVVAAALPKVGGI